MFVSQRRKRFKRTLNDSLRTDVNPRTSGHLPVHRQAEFFVAMEFVPVRPMAYEIGIGDEYARRVFVSAKDAYGFAGLHQQGFVVGEIAQAADDGFVSLPVARGFARTTIHNQLIGSFGDFGVEVVHQHAQRGFLLPAFATDLIAARRTNYLCIAHNLPPSIQT